MPGKSGGGQEGGGVYGAPATKTAEPDGSGADAGEKDAGWAKPATKDKKDKKKAVDPNETTVLKTDDAAVDPSRTSILVVDDPPPNPRHALQTRNIAIGVLVWSVVVALGTAIDLHYPGRMAFTVLFAGFVPGWVAVAYIRFRERLVEIIGSVALSVAMGIILAMTQLQSHAWNPRIWVTVWAVLAAGGAVPHILRKGRAL
ncbi:hypothetical protein [Paractinoplanes durhamensis]|uniref:hypothetical protein n=1 Tax=Paractinoplanes durhamensis TaxID=113563 RepID=UPI003624B7F8